MKPNWDDRLNKTLLSLNLFEEPYETDLKTKITKNSYDIESLGAKIEDLETMVSNHNKLLTKTGDLGNKWDCVIRLVHAVQCQYQYWEYFLAFRTACACKTYSDIAKMKLDQAYKKINDYNLTEKSIQGSVSKEIVANCIEAAKNLTSVNE